MTRTHIHGFPRIGRQRELKHALESYWRGDTDARTLSKTAAGLRRAHWNLQIEARLDLASAGDFALYDHVLEHTVMLGALPPRFGFDPAKLTIPQYFELARGNEKEPAMEMTKWFDTNYHYIVPELSPETRFDGGVEWFFDAVREALAMGVPAKPVLLGPVTYLWLSKSRAPGFDRLQLLPALLDAYRRILARLREIGVEWIQLDEPALCTDLEPRWLGAYGDAYGTLGNAGVKLMLATYFGDVVEYADEIARLPVQGIHLDFVRAPSQLDDWQRLLPAGAVLSAGIIDGRNVWRTDLRHALDRLRPLHAALGERLWLAPSCSLLHVPLSVSDENGLDPEVRPWLAFAVEKLGELALLARGLNDGEAAIAAALAASDAVQASRRSSSRATNETVRRRASSLTAAMTERRSTFATRNVRQREALQLPALPTTTIGSFPQTAEIRKSRAAYKRREIGALAYLQRIRGEIEKAVREQEALGLDVLVHGEAERNDMVEYFAEYLWGYAFTENGWVQSYGSRCVKPPIIYGDVYRPEPITVDTARYAQSLTAKPMKGMLTGPLTMLQWSFVRDDQRRADTALQIALALRDEVADLQQAGIRVIQIDEPALREGLPLRRRDWPDYLAWATRAFKVTAAVVEDETQIHTHMCYSEFNDILGAIAELDADVITIETSRSNMELLDAFAAFEYPNEIGPGVYDIHSPRVASAEEMVALLQRAAQVIPPHRLWVNPDCGLKTRGWAETRTALRHMVAAAHRLRTELAIVT